MLWRETEREGEVLAGKEKGALWGGFFVRPHVTYKMADSLNNHIFLSHMEWIYKMADSLNNHISSSHMGWIWGSLNYTHGWTVESLSDACLMSIHAKTYAGKMNFDFGDIPHLFDSFRSNPRTFY